MSKEALQLGHETTKAFLRTVIREGVYLQRPKHTSPKQWSKQRKIGFRYALQEDTTLKDLGRDYGGTIQNTATLNHHFLDNLWNNSPPELQAQYPRETISDRKPQGQRLREEHSKRQGGISLRVKRLVEEKGVTDPKQIKRTLGISTLSLAGARTVLKGWEIEIPRESHTFQELPQIAQIENDDEKLQETLNRFSDTSLRGFLGRDREHKILTTISTIARKEGFVFHNRQVQSIAEKIKKAEIPIRQIEYLGKNGKLRNSYYVVYAKHTDRIAEALENDPDLQR